MLTLCWFRRFAVGPLMAAVCLVGCAQERAAPPEPPPPSVSIARPVLATVQSYHEYNGNLEAIETVQVQARVKGFLDAVIFREGDEVKKGDLLFKIDPREYTVAVKRAEADLRRATTELDRYRSEADRASRLRGSRAIGTEEYEQRVAVRDTAAAAVMQAQALLDAAKLQLGYTEIFSPIHGQISRTLVTRGNLVGQNEPTLLTTIVSMDPLYVYFDTPERDLVAFQRARQEGVTADVLSQTLPVEIGVTTEEDYPHAGKIDFRENRVDVGTGTVRLRGRIPNPRVPPGNARLLYPGLYARVRVPAGAPRTLPAIPEDALMTGQEGRFVYVLGDGDLVQKRTVTVGPQVWKGVAPATGPKASWTLFPPSGVEEKPRAMPSVVTVESGLTLNDRVIVNGLTKARPGTPVAPQAWELKPPPAGKAK
ncbi:MAG: efflux RND transporter periplasmic adaptor subunit [Gemmataceae bacterium]